MASQKVKLLGFWVSPFVYRVEWALKLKGVEYEYIEEDVFNKSPLLLELNPVHKKVPVLVHDQKVVLESFLILEYIDETWKQCPLLPQDPYQRVMARFLADLAEKKILGNAFSAVCFHGDEKEKSREFFRRGLGEDRRRAQREVSKVFGGENIGYLDLALGWMSYWLPLWEEIGSMKILDPIRFPATIAWMNNFLNHPVIREKLPPRDKMMVYFQELASSKKG